MSWSLRSSGVQLKVLDFDIETRRVGFYSAGRFAPDGCEPVIIAACWDDGNAGPEDVFVWGIGENGKWSPSKYRKMIARFRRLYEQADIVTGHYITKFDLPILNGACLECGLGKLPPKLVIDTKCDLVGMAGLSKSQENLSELLELEASKFHMNDTWWRKVARLTPEGLELARTRVVDDVIQHVQLRNALAGWLAAPTEWKP